MDSFNIQNYFKRGKTVVLTLRQGEDDGVRQWTDKDTSELLKLMSDFLPEFQNKRRRKKEVWVDVSKQLEDSGYTWTPEDCRKKWSNMIRTFKGIEEQKQDPTSNLKRVKWPFYDVMLELLSVAGSDDFPEAIQVCQLINSGRDVANGPKTYKSRSFLPPPPRQNLVVETVGVHQATIHHQQQQQQQQQQQRHQDTLQIGTTEADVIGVGGHMSVPDQGPSLVVPSTPDLDSNMLFTDSFKKASVSPPISIHRHSLAIRSKKRALLKRKNNGKSDKSGGDHTPETSLQRFIEATNKQNEQMLDKITSFHDNALALMHERNELLREIRDSLHEDPNHHSGSLDSCHHHHVHQEDVNSGETLTLHMGPAYSTAVDDSQNHVGSQLNSALVISADPATASALSTFQLEDGTVLSGMDTTQDKTGLSNLGSFADSVLPDVSMLHPTLVQVVTDSGGNTTNMTLAIPTNAGKRSLGKNKYK